jgi:hypothetical protein
MDDREAEGGNSRRQSVRLVGCGKVSKGKMISCSWRGQGRVHGEGEDDCTRAPDSGTKTFKKGLPLLMVRRPTKKTSLTLEV